MTSPTPIEDRLRAHFAERTATEPLPGPDTETALADTLRRGSSSGTDRRPPGSTRPPVRWLAAAAALLAVGAAATAAAALVVRDDDPVSTTPGPDDPTTTTTTQPTTTTTALTPLATPTLVLGQSGPLGGWDGERWVAADAWDTTLGFGGDEQYRLVRPGHPLTTGTSRVGPSCQPSGDPEPSLPFTGLPGGSGPHELPGIGVVGVEDPQPRPVQVLDPGAGTYVDDARQVLAGLGVDEPSPQITQAVRADLDGDGSDEVLVVVERVADLEHVTTDPGDYSVVYLRRLVDGKVRDTVVDSDIHPIGNDVIHLFRVDAIADVNGDGRMEVAILRRYYEGYSDSVRELGQDGELTEVLEGFCGD